MQSALINNFLGFATAESFKAQNSKFRKHTKFTFAGMLILHFRGKPKQNIYA
ncbi:MAG: hypothetical protein H8D87_03210 [Deltaproteobacteria bacterium]|uniref:hypothetical protein n=1 Tax=Desulfobacula sp. TaxID=2593537 RepID=UPI001996110A|nr:hypothetical protein [Candidatus Desulfobacula maris]MBL6995838.1 hypothetical protein [Desulfobacula sp.]